MTLSGKYRQMNATIAKTVVRLLCLLVVSFFTRVSVYAGEPAQTTTARVHFPINVATLDSGYLDNARALAEIREAAFRCAADPDSRVEIVSYSSPEGNIDFNQYLSGQRAASLRRFILSKYPTLRGRITVNASAEAWGDLREAVVSDTRLDDGTRARVLALVDADMDSDLKEAELKKLPSFRYLFSNFFKSFRYAEITLTARPVERLSRFAVRFPLNSVALDRNYGDNAAVLKALDTMLKGRSAADFKEIRVVSGSSPDGPVALNESFAGQRGASLVDYINANYPEFSSLINLQPQGEAWAELREIVINDRNLSQVRKNEILDIIDNLDLGAQAKEAALRSNASWKYLQDNVLPLVR